MTTKRKMSEIYRYYTVLPLIKLELWYSDGLPSKTRDSKIISQVFYWRENFGGNVEKTVGNKQLVLSIKCVFLFDNTK